MKGKVTYYGLIAERINKKEEHFEFEEEKTINLRSFFENKYPELNSIVYKIAINQELSEELMPDSEEVEISLLPPFAGG